MTKNKVYIEDHSTADKRFEVTFPYASVFVDYDDVHHQEVDAAIEVIKEIVDKYWDENLFKKKLKALLIKRWEENEHDLQDDYESLEEYLHAYGYID